jgi:hypothetical protein
MFSEVEWAHYNKGCEPNAKDATKPLVLRIWYLSPNRKPNSLRATYFGRRNKFHNIQNEPTYLPS